MGVGINLVMGHHPFGCPSYIDSQVASQVEVVTREVGFASIDVSITFFVNVVLGFIFCNGINSEPAFIGSLYTAFYVRGNVSRLADRWQVKTTNIISTVRNQAHKGDNSSHRN